MALNKYTLTSTVTIPAGTITMPVAGEPATGGSAGFGNASISSGPALFPTMFVAGQVVVLDPAGPLYAAIGAGNLKPFTAAQETGGSLGVSN